MTKDLFIGTDRLGATFDTKSGLLTSITSGGQKVPMSQNFFAYKAVCSNGQSKNGFIPCSGPYLSQVQPPAQLTSESPVELQVVKGPVVTEVHQTFSSYVSQIVRIYEDVDFIEFEWTVGPIPELVIANKVSSIEVISRFTTPIKSAGVFYTDSNGRGSLKRTRDSRPHYKIKTDMIATSNYYPVVSWIFIRNESQDLQLTVLTDRSQGGSSLEDGEIELMLHRRCSRQDYLGVDEPLDEVGNDGNGLIARGTHRVFVGKIQSSVRQMKMLSKSFNHRPLMVFQNRHSPDPNVSSFANLTFTGLKGKLPQNVKLLTLEPWSQDKLLIRLEHIFKKDEDPLYSRAEKIDLADLFTPFVITSLEERTLNVVHEKVEGESCRLKFDSESDSENSIESDGPSSADAANSAGSETSVTIYPMEVRTFLVSLVERDICSFGLKCDKQIERLLC